MSNVVPVIQVFVVSLVVLGPDVVASDVVLVIHVCLCVSTVEVGSVVVSFEPVEAVVHVCVYVSTVDSEVLTTLVDVGTITVTVTVPVFSVVKDSVTVETTVEAHVTYTVVVSLSVTVTVGFGFFDGRQVCHGLVL